LISLTLFGVRLHQGDLSALVFDNKSKLYVPYNKQWVKESALRHLKEQVS
jgi:hypothetical protein